MRKSFSVICLIAALCCGQMSIAQSTQTLKKRAQKALQLTIPEMLLDETSYSAVSSSDLIPIYQSKRDIENELEEIKYLMRFSDDIVLENLKAGLSYNDFALDGLNYTPYVYGLDWSLLKMGFFNSDELIAGDSFYGYSHQYHMHGNERNNYPRKDNGVCFNRIIIGYMSERVRTVESYRQFKEDVLLPRYVELSNKLKGAKKNTLIGYDMEHKYNAKNMYGGTITKKIDVHFDISCSAYWYLEEDTIVRVEHIRGLD